MAVRIHLYIKHEQKYCRLNAINCWTASFSTTGRREEYSFVSAVVKSVLSAILPTNAKHGTSGAAIPADTAQPLTEKHLLNLVVWYLFHRKSVQLE